MNKASTYLLSLILSVFFVFLMIVGSAVLLFDINFTPNKLKKLADKNDTESKIYTEIDKYYSDKYNTTGIPADVYMSAVDKNYIKLCEYDYIDSAFDALKTASKLSCTLPKNQKLEDSIDSFFNDFADKNNYEKDNNFQEKLTGSKKNAYSSIGTFCDIYKFSTMSEHGVLTKLSKIYSIRMIITGAVIAANIVVILLLIAINRKKKITAMYWCGISSLVAGILGGVPSVYLTATRFYDSFSIKQASVFSVFTGAMYKYTEAFMAVMIAFIVVGVSLIVTYGVIHDKKKYPNTKPTEI